MTTKLRSLWFALVLGASACTGHIVAHGTMNARVVTVEPPPPQVETITVQRPGHVWIKGHYEWRNNAWAWVGGHWERERAGFVWVDGRWQKRGSQWHWVDGRWDASGGVTVRDHRDHGDVEVRDHRGHGDVEVRDHRGHGDHHGDVEVRDHRGGGEVTVTIDINGDYPNVAPPALQVENPGPAKANLVWARGRWDWKKGVGWQWVPGHWERARAGKTWVEGRWELQGKRWTWVEGGWR